MTAALLLARERSRLGRLILAAGALAAAAAVALLAAAGVMTLGDGRWLRLPALAAALVWLVGVLLVAAVVWATRRRLRSQLADGPLATAVERDCALRQGSLRGALEVADTGPLGRLAARQLADRLPASARTMTPSMRDTLVRHVALASGALAVGGLLAVAGSASAADGWAPLAHPLAAARGTLLPSLQLDVPALVLRGEPVPVAIVAPSRQRVELHYRVRGSAWRVERLAAPGGRARTRLPRADADLELAVTDGRAWSDTIVVRVTDRPFVGDLVLRAVFPAYLHRRSEPLVAGEPLHVPRGTVVTVSGRASVALARVALARGTDTVRLGVDDHRFSGRLLAVSSGRYTWHAAASGGAIADLPAALDLDVMPDSAPRVDLLAPARDTAVVPSDEVPLRVSVSDDHGLAGVSLLASRRSASGSWGPEVAQRLTAGQPSPWLGGTMLALGDRALQPGDVLRIVVEATDDSPWAQRARSREILLRVPGLSEQRVLARRAADSAVAGAAAAAAAQRDLQQRTSDASRARGDRQAAPAPASAPGRSEPAARGARSAPLAYEAAERARSLAAEQRALTERVQNLERAAKALERQLREAGALDTALAARLAEVRALLREALTPELAARMRDVEEAARSLQADRTRQALGDLAAQQQRLREQLDKSVEMLTRAALEGAMQTLADEAKDVARAARAAAGDRADSAGKGGTKPADGAAPDAKSSAVRSRDVARDASTLARRLERAKAAEGARRVAAAGDHAAAAAAAMARAGEPSAEPNSSDDAGKFAQTGASEMEEAARQLAEARAAQIEEWKQELTKTLDQSILETLQLAREQDALADKIAQGTSPQELRAQQGALQQGAEKAGERLERAGAKSALLSPRSQRQMREARQKMADATRQAGEQGGGERPGSTMRDAAAALNQAAASLVRDRERAGNASSASGFSEMLERMRELARQQGALNAQASGMATMPSLNGAAGEQAGANVRALARQQRAVAQALDEVGEGDATGKADELAAEARRIAQALERGVVDQSTLERQQRLFRRLLDAGQSLEKEERDDQGKREARSGSGSETFVPGAAPVARDGARFRVPTWEELRGLSPDERRLVIEYFKRLNAEP